MNPDGLAGREARSLSGKAPQTLCGAALRFTGSPLVPPPPPRPVPLPAPPECAAGGFPIGLTRLGSHCPQPEGQCLSEAVGGTEEALVTSTPIPSTSCLPSWATKGPREAEPFQPQACFSPFGVERGFWLCQAIVCAGGGERLGQDPRA